MNSQIVVRLLITCALTAFLISCGKKSTDTEPAAGAEPAAGTAPAAATPTAAQPTAPAAEKGIELEGERDVRQALAKKDYATAVTQVVAMRRQVPPELTEKYIAFTYEVRNTLQDASATDLKATEALHLLGALQRGR